MSEFNTEEQRVGYIDGLIAEEDAAKGHLEKSLDAEKSLRLEEQLAAIAAEKKRLGIKVAEERPATKAGVESR